MGMEMQYSDELRLPGGNRVRDRGVSVTGQELDCVASALAEQFALLYEVSPAGPYATFGGGMLTFAFHGGFTELDEHRLATGRAEEVRKFRERFLRGVAEELNEVVEAMIPAVRVCFFFAGFDVAAGTTSCFFVLDPVADSERAQREAILAWSDQVRRNSRGLRLRTRHARDATRRLAQGFPAPRRESDSD
jgi:hypothetical protein